MLINLSRGAKENGLTVRFYCPQNNPQSKGNCEGELPEKPVGQVADSQLTGFALNTDYQLADRQLFLGKAWT